MDQKLHESEFSALSCDVFSLFPQAMPLLTAGNRQELNTMVIGWGGLGTLWRKPVCTVYVRPQRYTYEFMERQDYFTVSVLNASHAETLKICGTRSGRDIDKVKTCGLSVAFGEGDAPYFEEAELVLVCRKLYADDIRGEAFVDLTIDDGCYPDRDYHRMYVGEVLQVLKK